ncbi:MAG: PD40 domain-containing protein, partial [Verrucomicrobia bacterium]|nr:PD40 domain-containing protein [Verrucomicrobiota bacterium]
MVETLRRIGFKGRFQAKQRIALGIVAQLALAFSLTPVMTEEARLLRFPAIHGDQVVFAYAGDLYTVAAGGGVARRLTSDVGYELFPRFSPDGRQLAFTAQYDGNTEVYLMPAAGGVPRRLTHTATLERDDVSDRMGPNNMVLGWRDDDRVVFRSRGTGWNSFVGQLHHASIQGGMAEPLPLSQGSWCSFSPDGRRMAFNRVMREFRTWKRYRGGMADDIWLYDFETRGIENLTAHPAQDLFPMWHGNRLYFVSDRDDLKRMNLYLLDLETREISALTRYTEFDVKFPSLGNDAIVFENGGYIHRLDLGTHEVRRIPITLQEDLAIGRDGWKEVRSEIRDYDLAPDGQRAVFGARGDIFTVPAKRGPTRNLTRSSGVHDRNATWSPDGRWIAYVSDASGEDEVYLMPQDGQSPPTQLTANGDTYKYALSWSPDSRHVLWADRKNRLQFVHIQTKEITLVDQATAFEISQYAWSPDSQWIAFTRPEERAFPRIALYSLAAREWRPVTDTWFAASQPAFSADGKLLFFISRRDFNPRTSQTEPNHAYFDMERIYFLTLAESTPSPFEPRSDEVKIAGDNGDLEGDDPASPSPEAIAGEAAAKESDTPTATGKKGEAKAKPVVTVDWDGLPARIGAVPVAASNYRSLTSVGRKLFYLRNGLRDERTRLLVFDLDPEKLQETDLGEANGYTVAAGGKKMLVTTGESAYAIIDLPSAKLDLKDRLNLGELKVELNRAAEWEQIYRECWRQMRDFMFDPNLHGVDWEALRRRYAPLVEHVRHRADLTYVIGELIGELNIGHAYVGGGDYPKAARIATGLLGARIERDPASGYFIIRKILPGQNWDPALRSPLTEIGVTAHEGDYLLAIDGQSTTQRRNLHAALVGKAGQQVQLRLNREPRETGSWVTTVVPIADESDLYYLDWVESNIRRVTTATDGRVGYVHIPDMGTRGLNEFVKYYYPQLRKEALIVDVRGNGGGNVSPQIIERLRREPAMITIARNSTMNFDPAGMVAGPKVMLLNEYSASDGDIVAYRFRKYGLGPIIGRRSWGGVVGIRGSLPL